MELCTNKKTFKMFKVTSKRRESIGVSLDTWRGMTHFKL